MLRENTPHQVQEGWGAVKFCTCIVLQKKSASQALLLALSSSNIRSLLIKNRQLFGSSFDVCAYSLGKPPHSSPQLTPACLTMQERDCFPENGPPPPSSSWSNSACPRLDLQGTWHNLPSGRLIFQKMRTNSIEWTANIINGNHEHAEIVCPPSPPFTPILFIHFNSWKNRGWLCCSGLKYEIYQVTPQCGKIFFKTVRIGYFNLFSFYINS